METTIKKGGITIVELIGASSIVFIAVLGFWKNTDVRLSRLELISEQQNKDREVINAKLDKLQEKFVQSTYLKELDLDKVWDAYWPLAGA